MKTNWLPNLRWAWPALLVVVGSSHSAENPSAAIKPSESSQQSSGFFQTQFQDESQFIVETIVSDLAEQVFYAKRHELPDARQFSVHAVETPGSTVGTPTYDLKINFSTRPALQLPLKINGPIWAAEVYGGVSAALAKEVGLPAATREDPGSDTSLLLELTDGLATTIEKQNQKLSKLLESNFASPSLHERAALLLGAFALREHSGDFLDVRAPLCRITSHLVMAQLLSGGRSLSVNGQIADVILQSLMNNQAAALKSLARITAGDLAVTIWVRTLTAYNTSDYRPLADSKMASLMERIAWYRAFAQSVGNDVAWPKLTDGEKRIPDFARIANENSTSVETAREVILASLPSELREIVIIYALSRGQALAKRELAAKLNELPGRCFSADAGVVKVSVIGWGQWAMLFQRQVCHAMQNGFGMLRRKWSLPEDAEKFSAQCEQLYGDLRLYPFVRRFNCTDEKSYHRAVDDGLAVTVATPHLTPTECWNQLFYRVSFAPLYRPNPNPHFNEWYKHNLPPGTAYNPLPRLTQPSLMRGADAGMRVRALHQLAPYDRDISFYSSRFEYPGGPTYEQAKKVYETVLPYATYAMVAVARAALNQPDLYEPMMLRAAELDPAQYNPLAEYCLGKGLVDKAVVYFQKANDLNLDKVANANRASWLIQYYLMKGETSKARKLADAAGEAYSNRGLQAKAQFFEITGDTRQALEWYLKIEERYKDANPTLGFYIRCKARSGDSQFDAEIAKRSAMVFPNGIEKTDLKDFRAVPTDGVYIGQENDLVRLAGLKQRDVIVSVFGVRVHNFKQYQCARYFDLNPEMTLVVWPWFTHEFKEIKASPPNHTFDIDFTDYSGK